jgi:hypothetical protein
MRDHIRILGILNIVMGCLTALIGIGVLIALGGAAGIVSVSALSGNDNGEAAAAPIIALIGICIAVFFIVLSLPSIIGGWGLLRFKPWARILMIIVSVFHLFNFPFGTALGAYGLWALLSEEGRSLFEGAGHAYVNPGSYPPPATSRSSYPPQPPSAV